MDMMELKWKDITPKDGELITQPSVKEITEKIQYMLCGKISREAVCDRARDYIYYDTIDKVLIEDTDAWDYLVAASLLDEMKTPGVYLFSDSDVERIADEYNKKDAEKHKA